MTDLISREAAIAAIRKEMLERKTPFTEREIGFWRGMLFCAEALTNTPSADSGWRPIETAPKDGTPILAFVPEESREYSFVYVLIYDELIPAWREAAGECYSQYVPSHWMPLPEFPA